MFDLRLNSKFQEMVDVKSEWEFILILAKEIRHRLYVRNLEGFMALFKILI